MQLGPQPFGDRAVRSLLDQHVSEPQRLPVGPQRANGVQQFLGDQRLKMPGGERARFLGNQLRDGVIVELLADHGGALDHGPLAGPEPI